MLPSEPATASCPLPPRKPNLGSPWAMKMVPVTTLSTYNPKLSLVCVSFCIFMCYSQYWCIRAKFSTYFNPHIA